MSELQQTGNELVLKGLSRYLNGMKRANQATEEYNQTLANTQSTAQQDIAPDPARAQRSFAATGNIIIKTLSTAFNTVRSIIVTAFDTAFSVIFTVVTGPINTVTRLLIRGFETALLTFAGKKIIDFLLGGNATLRLAEVFGGETALKYATAFQKRVVPKISEIFGRELANVFVPAERGFTDATRRVSNGFLGVFGAAGEQAEKSSKRINRAAKSTEKEVTQSVDRIDRSVTNNVTNITQTNIKLLDGLGQAFKDVRRFAGNAFQNTNRAINKLPPGLRVATKAAIVLGAAFIALRVVGPIISGIARRLGELGQAGAVIPGIAESFARLAGNAGQTADALLGNLRTAAAGSVSDLDLLRQANVALSGATGEVAQALGEGLPQLLEIARAQSRATGQDVNFLFESLVSGVKRSSPLLIDNTGLVVKLGAANEALAESLGKTVEDLTDQEKQIALLNATIKAGRASVEDMNRSQETNADLSAKVAATQQNAYNTIALAAQPLFAVFLRLRLSVAEFFQSVATTVGPLLNAVGEAVQAFGRLFSSLLPVRIIGAAFQVFGGILRTVIDLATFFAQVITVALNTLANVYNSIVDPIVQGIENAIQSVFATILEIFPFLNVFEGGMFRSGGRIMAAFAAGILAAANATLFPTIELITGVLADFLIGRSPPPKGPLSTIDKGGANTMLAWLKGFTGVSLDPVNQVAQQVVTALGEVATLSLQQVETRFAQLDAALLPFENRLKLVQARIEALTAPLETYRDIVNDQLNNAVALLESGEVGADQVRELDQQLEAINQRTKALAEEQRLSEFQLQLAKALQAEERARLEIRQAQLSNTEAQASAAEKASKAATGGAGSNTDPASAIAGIAPVARDPNAGANLLSELLGGRDPLGDFTEGFNEAFADIGGNDQLAQAQASVDQIGKNVSDIGTGIGNNPIVQFFSETLPNTIGDTATDVQTELNNVFGENGTVVTTFNTLKTNVENTVNSLFGEGSVFRTAFNGAANFVRDTFSTDILEAVGKVFSTGGLNFEGSLLDIINGSIDTIFNEQSIFRRGFNIAVDFVRDTFGPAIKGVIDTIFGEGTADSISSTISNGIDGAFGESGVLRTKMNESKGWVQNTFGPALQNTFEAIFGGEGLIVGVFSGFTGILKTQFLDPVVDVMNGFIAIVIAGFQGIVDQFNYVLNYATNNLAADAVSLLTEAVGIGSLSDLRLPDIPGVTIPYFQFHKGGVVPGRTGREVPAVLQSGEGVLSLPMMRTLSNLERSLAYAPPVISRSSSNTVTHDNRSIEVHNHHPTDTGNSIIRAKQRAWMGW